MCSLVSPGRKNSSSSKAAYREESQTVRQWEYEFGNGGIYFFKNPIFNRFPLLYSFRVHKIMIYGSSPQVCVLALGVLKIEKFRIQIWTYVFFFKKSSGNLRDRFIWQQSARPGSMLPPWARTPGSPQVYYSFLPSILPSLPLLYVLPGPTPHSQAGVWGCSSWFTKH